ncbi:MAG: Ig-like domain-containing protein [Patescibacteria group bacterium]|nr:Ig-like domain-containing protein [Patescibacteria group bacterium]
MGDVETKTSKLFSGKFFLVFSFILLGGFLFAPKPAGAAWTLPTTACDQQQEDFQIYYVNGHLTDTSQREDGTRAFDYGANGEPFVSADANSIITFNFHTLFTAPTSTISYVKVLGFASDCSPIFGLGPAFTNPVSPGDHTLTYADNGHTITLDGDTQIQYPSATARYIWIEAWDGVSGSTAASYSYLVDLQNVQNPTDDSVHRLNPDPVIIIPGILGSEEKDGIWTLDPIMHTYDDLVDTLKANGYVEGYDLFLLPYDWRQSNVETAIELKLKINEAKQACSCNMVDIVAHSMGGLVAREYIESDSYENDVDQLIFLGTPQYGSPKAYLGWEGGEVYPDLAGNVIKFVLEQDAFHQGYLGLYDYVHNKPVTSLQELLPIKDYLRDKDTGEITSYPQGYPRNEFLEQLDNNISLIAERGVKVSNITGELGLGSTLNIIRIGDPGLSPLWEHGQPDGFDTKVGDRGLELGTGDDTVPTRFSLFPGVDPVTLSSRHTALPDEAKSEVYELLTGHSPQQIVDNFHIPGFKVLLMKVLSPVDFVVTAPDGKKIGKNFATGEEYGQIPYAFYSGFNTDNEYITILNPEDGEYKLDLQGTGEGGEYTVVSSYVSDNNSVSKEFTGTTLPQQLTTLDLNVNNSAPEDLSLESEDTQPPKITITEPAENQYLHSDTLPIQADVSDSGTGVESVKHYFNGTEQPTSTVDLFYQPLGPAEISVSAQDYAGNQATSTKEITIIATPESTVSDINRAYDLGWITSTNARDRLINQVQRLVKLQTRFDIVQQRLPNGRRVRQRVERIEKEVDRVVLVLFNLEFNLYHRRGIINDQAYTIIKNDIEWIIKN